MHGITSSLEVTKGKHLFTCAYFNDWLVLSVISRSCGPANRNNAMQVVLVTGCELHTISTGETVL